MTTMKLTDDAKAFYLAVYHVVNQIPVGHVVSYGMCLLFLLFLP